MCAEKKTGQGAFVWNNLIVQWTGKPAGRRQLNVSRAESWKVKEYFFLVKDSMIILISENKSEKTSLRSESH